MEVLTCCEPRLELIFEIYKIGFRIQERGLEVSYVSVPPVHVGIERSEDVDISAMQSLRFPKEDIQV